VTRIISGYAGSRRLTVPKAGTRPTSDRVREAIFSALEARDVIPGASVLDLYAGSGALGLEAASRGASDVVLVERNAAAAKVAKGNVAVLTKDAPRPAPRIQVSVQSVSGYLATAVGPFDIVFIDPPYDIPENEVTETLELLATILSRDAVVVVERSSRSPEPTLPPTLAIDRRKDYGETTLWWLSPTE
jgi:16S rRNA (guanine966-N2)-methyltransferase